MTNQKITILRLPEVIRRTGISRSSIYAYIQKDEFPAPISVTANTSGWLETEIQEWLESRIQASRNLARKGDK